jgi:prepilin-type processing-associated H-X9-DG protein
MSETTQPRLSKAALVAFVLGISSLLLSVATALPALYIGMQAIRAINRSDGLLRGQRLAIAALVLGGVVTLVSVLGTVGLVILRDQERNHLTGCTNNLRLLGAACNRYRDHHDDHFPPGTVLNASLPPERRLSWQAAIVPFLMEGTAGKRWQKLAEDIAFEEAWDAPTNAAQRRNVAPFLCPAFARGLAADQVGLTAYVGVAGLGDDAARLPLSDPRAGFFGYDRLLTQADISAPLDATMVALETQQDNGCWMAGGMPTVRGVERDRQRYIGMGQPFGGLHREGVNVLWADGSVHIVNEGVAPIVFRVSARIARPQGE